jgi:hypothetical protein
MNKTKLSKVKELLAKMLEVEVEFASATTDKGIIFYEGELAEGINVYVEDAEGNKVAAEDGTYTIEEEMTKKIIEVKNGVVVSIEELEITVEEPVEEEVIEETPIEAEEPVENPTNDGEESTVEAIVKIREEINELYSIVDTLKKEVEELKNKPTAKPVTEEFEAMAKQEKNLKGASRYTQHLKK